jgi:hypothetical protein
MTWRERLVAARERGAFTDEDRLLAAHWRSCAVGEQHAAMPTVVIYDRWRHHNPVGCNCNICLFPADAELVALGGQNGFCGAVLSNDFAAAEGSLDAIEDRVLQLKRGER